MEFGILGPLAVWDDGRELPLGPAGQRALLAVLLIHAGEVVPTARVVDELWGERPPARAVKTVQVYVSQLRKLLGDGAIETRPAGYLVRVDAGALDLQRFEGLLERGRTLLEAGAAAEAAPVLRDALAVWRGPALADFEQEAFARNAIGRLEELRLVALTLRLEADLALGRQAEIVPELEALIREHPLREPLRELLILALYRAGRQADALAAYHDARTTLVDQLGLDPGQSLRNLEKAILLQDTSLDLARPAGDLPTGTVTFLFTDVEGSTEQLARLGPAEYAQQLDQHRRVLRAAFAGGREVDTQGDAFFVAFPSATGAVNAAAQAQRALADNELQARIGIHTGEPLLGPTGYVGLDVPRAARVCSAGHGGQVLISQATRELVEAELPDDIAMRDLGEHRLKDLTRPQRLTQLVIHGLRNDFPPLRTLENRPTNLPTQTTMLIGRRAELEAVTARLGEEDVRLLSLTGPGGSGKTRLALQAAAELVEDFPQGVFFVALASIEDPALVLPTIAQTLGLATTDEGLAAFVAERRLLLVLDNFEHVVEAAPSVGRLLAGAANLKLLVTSRIPLRLSAEREYPVPPLELPDPAHLPTASSLSQYDAVELFVERARAVKPDFDVTNENAPALAELCVRLDGLPLAIELAAARAKLLPPQALLARLEQSLDLLTGGARDAPERQKTLRATIDWSHGLLGAAEQTLFARLAVFHGGSTLDAAQAVCGGEDILAGLTTLVDDNMLRQEEQPDGEPRFTMLETIRAYAVERLEASGEADELRLRHALWFASVDGRMQVDSRFGEVDYLRLDRDLDNFRAAHRELITRDEHESLVRLISNLGSFWIRRGHLREAATWCDEAVQLAADMPLWLQARVWECAGGAAFWQHDLERSAELFRQAFDARRGDRPDDVLERAWTQRMLSLVASERGEDEFEVEELSEQAAATFRELGYAYGVFVVAHDQSIRALKRSEYDRARQLLDRSVADARALGSIENLASVLLDVGILELREHRYTEAGAVFAETLERGQARGLRAHVALSLRGLAGTAATAGALERAARMLGAADTIEAETGWVLEPYERDAFAEAAGPVLARADEPEIAAAMAAGRAMSDSDAAAFALAGLAEEAPV